MKWRRLISPPKAQHSSVFSLPPIPSSRTEYGHVWVWSVENDSMSVDCGPMGWNVDNWLCVVVCKTQKEEYKFPLMFCCVLIFSS